MTIEALIVIWYWTDLSSDEDNTIINSAMKYFNIVIVRLDRIIQNLVKTLDSPIKSGNDEYKNFKCFLAGLIIMNANTAAGKVTVFKDQSTRRRYES